MKYIALTGATGLLGSYLLAELLAADIPVAALVRSNRRENARQRIESTVHIFERRLGRALPRPVVIESDLCQPLLGLDKDNVDWFCCHVDTMLHNAASLSFVAEKNGEPYRSNIDGTKNVLDLCRKTGISRFHHVSTAYVCGLRTGTIHESDFDAGQEFGNDYEKSKFASEKMVREASFIRSLTVFRPAIIVGDSRTGYTPTYHGFYAPLKILTPLVSPEYVSPETAEEFGQILGMKPGDQKNYVPVDWIAEVMSHVVLHERLHGSCYHLAPENCTRMDAMSRIMAEGIHKYKPVGKTIGGGQDLSALFQTFLEQMEVYKSYWRCDPVFDMSNTRNAAPHLPPPMVDEKMLQLLIRFAIGANFGWPLPKPVEIGFDASEHLRTHATTVLDTDCHFVAFTLRITGLGGGDWTIRRNADQVRFERGLAVENLPMMTMNSVVFERFVNKKLPNPNDMAEYVSWENGSINDRWAALKILETLQSVHRTNSQQRHQQIKR